MISTSAVLLRRLTLFDDTLKNLRSGLDKGPIILYQYKYAKYALTRRNSLQKHNEVHTTLVQ